jgi:hypothetical protein
MNYTLFNYDPKQGMCLRSKRAINCVANTPLYKDLSDYLYGHNVMIDHTNECYSYCNKCKLIFGMFNFLEKHYKELRGEKKNTYGPNNWLQIYMLIRIKLEEFIDHINTGKIKCECDIMDKTYGYQVYNNISYMQILAEKPEYHEYANYQGYGEKRRRYRMYHKNFFVYHNNINERGEEDLIIDRDFKLIKSELQHWLNYFNKDHQTIVDEKNALLGLNLPLNNDCISSILKFI